MALRRDYSHLLGVRLINLTIISLKHQNGSWVAECRCQCGTVKDIALRHVLSGATQSCGCLRSEWTRANKSKHGMCKSPEYYIWHNMRNRCHWPKSDNYHNYGGRGIIVCIEWRKSFDAFFRDMGPRPSPSHELDRIDVNGNYERGNCRWTTKQENYQNRRCSRHVVVDGRRMTLKQWSTQLGVDYRLVWRRLRNGEAVESISRRYANHQAAAA